MVSRYISLTWQRKYLRDCPISLKTVRFCFQTIIAHNEWHIWPLAYQIANIMSVASNTLYTSLSYSSLILTVGLHRISVLSSSFKFYCRVHAVSIYIQWNSCTTVQLHTPTKISTKITKCKHWTQSKGSAKSCMYSELVKIIRNCKHCVQPKIDTVGDIAHTQTLHQMTQISTQHMVLWKYDISEIWHFLLFNAFWGFQNGNLGPL